MKGKTIKCNYNTQIWAIEDKYKLDLWVRSDMKVSTYLRKWWFSSLADILDNK